MPKKILAVSAIIVALLCAAYWWWQWPVKLSANDSILVGELANESGEKDFDGSLREALRVGLLQSPFLNLLSDERIRATLRELGKPESTPIDAGGRRNRLPKGGGASLHNRKAFTCRRRLSNRTKRQSLRRCPKAGEGTRGSSKGGSSGATSGRSRQKAA